MWRQIKWEWGWEESRSLLQLLMQEKVVAGTGVSVVTIVKSDHIYTIWKAKSKKIFYLEIFLYVLKIIANTFPSQGLVLAISSPENFPPDIYMFHFLFSLRFFLNCYPLRDTFSDSSI